MDGGDVRLVLNMLGQCGPRGEAYVRVCYIG
jgi:hypothetical protein